MIEKLNNLPHLATALSNLDYAVLELEKKSRLYKEQFWTSQKSNEKLQNKLKEVSERMTQVIGRVEKLTGD